MGGVCMRNKPCLHARPNHRTEMLCHTWAHPRCSNTLATLLQTTDWQGVQVVSAHGLQYLYVAIVAHDLQTLPQTMSMQQTDK
jgi:hypothetical protein